MDYNKILTDEEFMEIKQHGSSDYPFQYYYDNLELFDFHCIEWHWHREFEFLYVESGEVTCGIGEKQIILSEGEAIFINSKILHRFYAPSGGIIPNFVCMPEFIAPENSLIYKKYILPIISSNIYFQRFQPDELWQTKIIQTMIKIMEIQSHCAFIRGKAIVGEGAVVGNSTELKNAVLFNKVQVPHYNYVGDAVLGYKSHMGAGSICSNVKSDKKLVVVKDGDEKIETGLKKFGAMLGDHVEVGCGSVLNPGTVIGRNSNIYPLSPVRGCVPADSIYKNAKEIVKKK